MSVGIPSLVHGVDLSESDNPMEVGKRNVTTRIAAANRDNERKHDEIQRLTEEVLELASPFLEREGFRILLKRQGSYPYLFVSPLWEDRVPRPSAKFERFSIDGVKSTLRVILEISPRIGEPSLFFPRIREDEWEMPKA